MIRLEVQVSTFSLVHFVTVLVSITTAVLCYYVGIALYGGVPLHFGFWRKWSSAWAWSSQLWSSGCLIWRKIGANVWVLIQITRIARIAALETRPCLSTLHIIKTVPAGTWVLPTAWKTLCLNQLQVSLLLRINLIRQSFKRLSLPSRHIIKATAP